MKRWRRCCRSPPNGREMAGARLMTSRRTNARPTVADRKPSRKFVQCGERSTFKASEPSPTAADSLPPISLLKAK